MKCKHCKKPIEPFHFTAQVDGDWYHKGACEPVPEGDPWSYILKAQKTGTEEAKSGV